MFFVLGWGRQTNKDLGPTLPVMCPNCKNEGIWHHHQSQLWFTLFFLPVFPYQSKHLLLCDVCSRGAACFPEFRPPRQQHMCRR